MQKRPGGSPQGGKSSRSPGGMEEKTADLEEAKTPKTPRTGWRGPYLQDPVLPVGLAYTGFCQPSLPQA